MRTPSHREHAGEWAASLWSAASDRWAVRGNQDRNYRIHVVHPAVREVLGTLMRGEKIDLLDLGCGDCAFLDDPENRAMIGNGGSYLGVDISSEMIRNARLRCGGERVRFIEGDVADPSTVGLIGGAGTEWNVSLSVFLLQEMPDAGPFLSMLGRVLADRGVAVAVTVHPAFGEWLRDAGHMETARERQSRPGVPEAFRWAGAYPIVDEPREPFFLPYFHRTEDDYRAMFRNAGFEVIRTVGIPDTETRDRLHRAGISPFVPFETNRYWPRIAEEPSALLIVAERGMRS
jgi:SAM-dependent methyltransferase